VIAANAPVAGLRVGALPNWKPFWHSAREHHGGTGPREGFEALVEEDAVAGVRAAVAVAAKGTCVRDVALPPAYGFAPTVRCTRGVLG
jgi:hypothetical protein